MSHDFVWGQSGGQSVAETSLGLFSSAKCRDRIWQIAKFLMRHRLIVDCSGVGINIIYDALPVKAPYCNVSTTISIEDTLGPLII